MKVHLHVRRRDRHRTVQRAAPLEPFDHRLSFVRVHAPERDVEPDGVERRHVVPALIPAIDDAVNLHRDALQALQTRIRLFVSLPIEKLDRMMLKRRTDEIGRAREPTDRAS